ncbi:hypothetical protein INT48_001162 [Thamnidium elegans]|uniref:Uncharacterized protein n=1 Tax=Thamnidium elegans TaxID=101142 RepID=A0A8H7SKE7_9FUNG|nr:hypothetical protein INT48_001162 [Thamnidium elegans]
MRQIATYDPEFSMYKDFFFSCSSFGSKQMFRGNILQQHFATVSATRLSLFKTVVITVLPPYMPSTSMKIKNFIPIACHLLETFPLNQKWLVRPSKFIAYNSMKTTFAGKTGPSIFTGFTGKHFPGMGLWRAGDTSTRMTHEWYKNRFEENENRAFPLRFEGHYTADVLNVQFLKKLSDQALAVKQHSCLLEADTALYMKYLNNRRELLETMSRHFSKKTDTESLSSACTSINT